jgi:CRISPR-associated endoribonuclease Cas6
MRFKLKLKQAQSNQRIPFNYQYPIHNFINYNLLKYGGNYLNWLEGNGFDQVKNYLDYFTFSYLHIPQLERENNNLKLLSDDLDFTIGILSEKMYEDSIINMFKNKKLRINSDEHSAEFKIESILKEEGADFSQKLYLKTISPIIISKKVIFNGYNSNYFMKPEDPDYKEQFTNVLIKKYLRYLKHSGKYRIAQKIHPNSSIKSFKITGPIKSRLITIEKKGKVVTKLRGFQYNFEISGDKNLLRFAFETGFGGYCGWGMGCVSNAITNGQINNSQDNIQQENSFDYNSIYSN